MAAVDLRYKSTKLSSYTLKRMHDWCLPLLEKALTRGNMEPPGVGDLLRCSLSDELHIITIGTVLTGYIALGQR